MPRNSCEILSVTLGIIVLFLVTTACGHTLEELRQEIGEVSASLTNITKAYESATDKVTREQLHAYQHEIALDRQRANTKLKCIELLGKIPALEREVGKLQKVGRTNEAEQMQVKVDQAKAVTSVACPAPR
jgi:hypothetical protein